MTGLDHIILELNRFIHKYYTKKLLKGLFLFVVLGLLFFLAVLAIEYFLWLGSLQRLVLFFAFVAVESLLLYKYILVPIFYLLRLKGGITNKEAAGIIGKHFPEVGDSLLNLLELSEDSRRSELLVASIEQRSAKLRVFPFLNAINYRESFGYLRFLLVPVFILCLIWFSGELSSFFGSFTRVVNYGTAYEPPAPFKFRLVTDDLTALDNTSFTVVVTTEGRIMPDNVSLVMEGREYFLQKNDNVYQYTFSSPISEKRFYFEANGVYSKEYRLSVVKAPAVMDFSMVLEYPKYTGRGTETVKGTGNAVIPEGTKVGWRIVGRNVDSIAMVDGDGVSGFARDGDDFMMYRKVYSDLFYALTTSNRNVQDYERLDYRLQVIRDLYPTIRVSNVKDSLNPNVVYIAGEATDDYGLSHIRVYCYPTDNKEDVQVVELQKPQGNFSQFYYTFPSGLKLDAGVNYSYYFEVVDNDAVHNGKSTQSEVYGQLLLNEGQLRNAELEIQHSIIQNMDRSLNDFKEQNKRFNELDDKHKESGKFGFSQQSQLKDMLFRQQQQEGLMEKFSKSLKENLAKEESDKALKKLLQERLERQEIEAKKNERLLEELRNISDKLDKEELSRRLEELGNKQQNSQRNLEQLLELTKRYYVTEKAAQLAKELERAAERQDVLADKMEKTSEEQGRVNEEFDRISEELKELRRDNEGLKKPVKLNVNESKERAVKKDQREALEGIDSKGLSKEQKEANESVKRKQRSAAQKMQEMSEALKDAASAEAGDTATEDAEMLRQILENLVAFSFNQESVYNRVKEDLGIDQFSEVLRKQRELRLLFQHVDDSLFSLSLRRAELSEFVNKQITEVYYNTDKSLERIVEGQMLQANASQQYVLTAANSLADFLAGVLDNMQQSMKPGQGSGQGNDFQLPDIIKGQGELKGKMEGMGNSGKDGSKGEGEANGKGTKGQGGLEDGEKEGAGKGRSGKDGRSQSDGDNGGGEGGVGEDNLNEIYEIYKTQQFLRNQLEQQLKEMLDSGDRRFGEKLIRQMEDFENDLLENGVTQRTKTRMNTIAYELLKLKNAELKQGELEEREAKTNRNQFQNTITTRPVFLENYHNETEILQRQALPLQQNFQNKVKEYFKKDD